MAGRQKFCLSYYCDKKQNRKLCCLFCLFFYKVYFFKEENERCVCMHLWINRQQENAATFLVLSFGGFFLRDNFFVLFLTRKIVKLYGTASNFFSGLLFSCERRRAKKQYAHMRSCVSIFAKNQMTYHNFWRALYFFLNLNICWVGPNFDFVFFHFQWSKS